MPKFGLTSDLIALAPWGIRDTDSSKPPLLGPAKTNTDPIHGDIHLTELERQIVDSPPFQRLRNVLQLGNAHLVYPGATHTRFAHSLGTMRAAQVLLDSVFEAPPTRYDESTLIAEWRAKTDPSFYKRSVAEATVLARLGALLHDFCHVPFGHTIEDEHGILKRHDANSERFDLLWAQIPEVTRASIPTELSNELRGMILSKIHDPAASKYPFVHDIVGNTICADLIDYLKRDFYYAGLPAALGTRLFSFFYVSPSTDTNFPKRMALRIMKRGRVRTDIVSEVLKYLRHRYELAERVLYLP